MSRLQRVAVIGPSGSGKTTLGRWMQARRELPFIDLDDLHWRPGWQPAPLHEFRATVHAVTQQPRWVIAENYWPVHDLVWARADTLLWLDLPLFTVLRRATRRALTHWWTGEPICNGNRQTLRHLVNGRDSLIGYTLRTYHRRRREWPALIARYPHLAVHRLGSAAAIANWQTRLQAAAT